MAASAIVRRGLLYVPASSPKFLQKSLSLSVDTVAYDLEDSVTPAKKPEARVALRKFLEQGRPEGVKEVAVRINSVDSGFALDDLVEVLQAPNLDALVIPKVNSAADLQFVTDVIRHKLPARHPTTSTTPSDQKPLRLLALIESAKSLISLSSICPASPYLSGLIFAAEDFSLDLSLTRTPSLIEMVFARQSIVTAARAFNLPSAIDLVCTSFRGDAGITALREECEGGRRMGFNGKQLIHPSQVGVAEEVFGPGKEEVQWAVRVLVGDEKAEKQGRGAWTLDGKMIDKPVVGKARSVVERAKLCGYDVEGVREEFKGQEPE